MSTAAEARWQAVFNRLLKTEGGFVDSPGDHGGATKYGLSLRFLAQESLLSPKLIDRLGIGHDGSVTVANIQALTIAQAEGVYGQVFWRGPGISTLPQPFDAALFDQAVNDGLGASVTLLQRAVNTVFRLNLGVEALKLDGVLGAITRSRLDLAIQNKGAEVTLQALRKEAADRYIAIASADPIQRRFLAGWLTRAGELGDV